MQIHDSRAHSGEPAGASMEDVALAAGVSVSTVSRALRDSASVRPTTIARVRAAADQLGFSVSKSAASLATGKVTRIAVLIGSPLTDWFSGAILDTIYRELRAAGYDLLLYRVHDADERHAFFDTLPARRNADALIVASFTLTEAEQVTLERMRMPVVYLNQNVPGSAGAGIDDREVGRAAAEFALGLGRERIVFVRESGLEGFRWSARQRYDGYLRALAATGPPAERAAAAELVEDDAGPDFGERVTTRILDGALPATVICENDEIAVSLLVELQRRGVDVPGRVAVIGFDGQPRAELHGLTTMVQPVSEMAAWVAQTAMRLARDGGSPRERLELTAELRVGTTTP